MAITCERYLVASARRDALERDARNGLASTPKSLPPVWFYDERGSELFEAITELPEYYLTRAERGILSSYAPRIAELAGCSTLVELGSGSSEKTRLLLDAMVAKELQHFVALDVSEEILVGSATKVHAAYGVNVTAIVGDFHHHLGTLPPGGRRLLAFLGSTIGNFEPEVRRGFLRNVAATMASGDRFLLGADLRKDPGRLIRAYDDAAGVTAEFNRNVLHVLNNELGADFAPERFEHVCVWDDSASRIEMRLRAVKPELVSIPAIGMEVTFAEGEELLTEISTKFQPEQLISELRNCGLATEGTWTDEGGDFMLVLTRPSEWHMASFRAIHSDAALPGCPGGLDSAASSSTVGDGEIDHRRADEDGSHARGNGGLLTQEQDGTHKAEGGNEAQHYGRPPSVDPGDHRIVKEEAKG